MIPEPAPLSDGEVGWGILATGGIAGLFTRDLLRHGHRVSAVGSRSLGRAQEFASEHGIEVAHSSYEALVADDSVDVVYVATPHNLHAAHALLALEAGKHVLVEKAFTLNAAQAATVVDQAARRGLLVMEAMWTRFLPHMAFVHDVIEDGLLGEIRSLHADHSQHLPTDPAHRLNDHAVGGGALLDLGVYPVSFAHDVLGRPHEVQAMATMTGTGVDASVATLMRHADDAVSTTYSTMRTRGPNTATVLGTEGRLDLDATWYAPTTVTLKRPDGAVAERYTSRVSGRGMQYQAREVERLLSTGRTVSSVMPPAASVEVMQTLDMVRHAIGLSYPDEADGGPDR